MKRFALIALVVLAGTLAALTAASPDAQAGVFGGKKGGASPSPSPSASALPTATPEPPSVAIPRLQAKLQANPNDQQAATQLAAEYLQVSRPDATAQITQHLLQTGDKSAQVYYYNGFALLQLGNIQGGIASLEQAANMDPTNVTVLAALADAYLRVNRDADAERVAKRGVTFNKDDPTAISALGSVYAAEQKFDDARAQFEAAILLDPKDPGPIFSIASTYADQNNIPMAVQTVDRALALDPKNVEALAFKANLYAKQHDDAKASEAFDDAVVAATTDQVKVQLMISKATYFVNEKKNPEAEAIFQQVVTQYPHVAAGFVAYGQYLAGNRQFDKATAQWQTALSMDPDNPGALLGMGELAMQNGRASDSINYLKHYTQISPDAQGFALLGQAYNMTRDFTQMRDACEKSFTIQRSPETLTCVAGADYQLRNYKEAAQIFDALNQAARDYLDRQPTLLLLAAKTYQAANQCTKSQDAYKRLLGLPGFKSQAPQQYAAVQKDASAPCGPPAKKKSS